ncbi:MAG: hypothetical protein JWO12_2230, partial [Frankiales bacterium]|nr:hypothetical protein [Frankiales bacterium]
MIPAAVLSHVGFRRDETQILRGIDLT